MKAGRKRDVARLLLIAVLATGLTMGMVGEVTGQPAEEAGQAARSMDSYGIEMTDLFDAGEVAQARALADRIAPTYLSEVSGNPIARALREGQLAYVRGDYSTAATNFETAFRAGVVVDRSVARLSRMLGKSYLRLGRIPDAIRELERSRDAYSRNDEIQKRGSVLTALGEAYRRAGRPAEARAALDESKKTDSKGGKGLAHLQLALLDYEAGDLKAAATNSQTAIEILRGPPARAGLAESYVIFGRIRFKNHPNMAGEAWRFVDMAREIDGQAPGLKEFIAELPPLLAVPAFESARPKFAFNRDIENGAMNCYETAPERENYLARINVEVERINIHIQNLDRHSDWLNRLISDYNSQGYLQEYQGWAAGRGYRYYPLVMAEREVIATKRAAAGARLEALRTWYGIARVVAVPCGGTSRSRLAQPASYQPRLPATDGYF